MSLIDTGPLGTTATREFQESIITKKILPELTSVLAGLGLAGSSSGGNNQPSLFHLPSLCCAALGKDPKRVGVAEKAWQQFYAAAHMIDAVEDDEGLPAGITSPAKATNLAVGLIFNAENELAGLEAELPPGVSRSIRMEVQRCLLCMCAGQEMSLRSGEISLEETWQIARLKSGAFFGLGCFIGARAGTSSSKILDGFTRFGEILGLLVQLGDDVKDLWSNEKGKSDLTSGHWGIPLAYAYKVLLLKERAQLREFLKMEQATYELEARIRDKIISSGALVYAALESNRLHILGKRILCSICQPSPARQSLENLLNSKGVNRTLKEGKAS